MMLDSNFDPKYSYYHIKNARLERFDILKDADNSRKKYSYTNIFKTVSREKREFQEFVRMNYTAN